MRLRTAVLAAVACLALAVPSAAIAASSSPTQDAYGGIAGQQQGGNEPSSTGSNETEAVVASSGEESTESSGELPFTGLEIGLIALVGVGLLGGGVLLYRASRQRTELQS